MKQLLPILFLLMLASCNNAERNSQSSNETNSVSSDSGRVWEPTYKTGAITSDYVFDLDIGLPKGFYFDTLNIYDSIYKSDYKLYCLQSSNPNMDKFNNAIKKEYIALVTEDRKDLRLCPEFNGQVDPIFTYELGPFEFYMDDKIVSLCCLIDTYGFSGNHHNYSWHTFNYDLHTNTIIRFKDVFTLNAKKDTVDFVDLISRNLKGKSCDQINSCPLDFSYVKEGICFNPELSWACSMNRSFLIADSLKQFMNKK